MNAEQQAKLWGLVVSKASQDAKFRKRLLSDPAAVVREQGIAIPAGVQLRIVENSENELYLPLPPLETERELSDAELEGVAGGLVVIAIIAVLIGMLNPSIQKDGLTMDQAKQVAGGNPTPRPR